MLKSTLFAAAIFAFSTTAAFAGGKAYQVTGPVLEISDSKIVVQKGSEKWEIARDSGSKVPADVKAGSKVTVHYTMTATEVEDKSPKSAEKKPVKK